jgi:PKD repeat protein
MREKVSFLAIIMLLCSVFLLVAVSDFNVIGIAGENNQESFDEFYDYSWFNITSNLSSVVHNDSIWGSGDEVIRKGRSFGTEGDKWTADYLIGELENMSLENIKKLQLGPIAEYPKWEYTSKVETIDFNLTCNSPYWNFTNDGHIPKNETFAVPSGKKNNSDPDSNNWLMDYNNTFNNIKLVPKNYTQEKWILDGAFVTDYLNVTNITELNVVFYICGFAKYVPINQTIPSPQIGRIFLLDEEIGCENQLDNITIADAAILLHNNTEGGSDYYTDYNFSNLFIQCARINRTENNLTAIIEMLNNGSKIIVDNFGDNQTLTFIHNFSFIYNWWPVDDFFIIGGDKDLNNATENSKQIWNWNDNLRGERGWCHGLIVYQNRVENVTIDESTLRNWMGRSYSNICQYILYGKNQPAIQIFAVNKSIGEFLENNASDPNCTISGYFEQKYIEENHTSMTPGVIAFNVEGNITTEQSPDNKIIVLSNRYDSWFNECPGDSGAGTGIVMGIAKYIKEKNIKPKYNLTFLFTTGEEYGMRGAWHYSHSHPESQFNIIRWIGVDQLGYQQPEINPKTANLTFRYNKLLSCDSLITMNIAEKSDYKAITGYGLESEWVYSNFTKKFFAGFISQTDDVAWVERPNCYTICIAKTGGWWRHHCVGLNQTEGDSMKYIDRTDVNTSFNIIWNITKYYSFDPDCWLKDISFTPWDSNSDDVNDSVNVAFTVNTSFPNDRVMVKAVLISQNHPILHRFRNKESHIITNTSGINDLLSITLPHWASKGDYKLKVYVFNSTGEVDNDLSNPYEFEFLNILQANDTFESNETFYLHPSNNPPNDSIYPPSGDTSIKAGQPTTYSFNTTDPEGDKIWYQWCYNTSFGFNYYSRWIMGGPYYSSEDCNRSIEWEFPGTYKVKVRAKDDLLNPNVMSAWSPELTVVVTEGDEGSSSSNNLLLGAFSSTVLLPSEQTSCNGLAQGVFIESQTRGSLNWSWNFSDGSPVSYGENVVHNYSSVGNYTANLTITNGEYWYNCTTNISVLILKADFNTSDVLQPNITIFFNDTSNGSYNITNWTWDFGDGNTSYQQNTNHTYPTTGAYNVSLTVKDEENNSHTRCKTIYVESVLSDFVSVECFPTVVGFGSDVAIVADFFDNQSMVNSVIVNMVYPDNSTENYTMDVNYSIPYDYILVFNDTWQVGEYNYSVYVVDNAGNVNCTSGFNFTVSAQANMSICTKKDEYGKDEIIEITDPPSEKPLDPIGYELLDNGSVLHVWNNFDHYYFNTSNGLQLTNHYNKYWSHNVLMLGYYNNNNEWNLVYRVDNLSGFNKNIVSDNMSFVNVTLWKDLSYGGYNFRLAIRYCLGVDDNELTVIPYIKNLGQAIPYTLGFAWEIKDIQVDMTPENDFIEINGTSYFLNSTLDETYSNLIDPCFYIREDVSNISSETLYLRWDENLDYRVWVKSRTGQYNAPVTLGIKIGTLSVNQEKYTFLFWHDASEVVYFFNDYKTEECWDGEPQSMVDGSVESFAFVSSGEKNVVELCYSNTCEGDNRGVISKVELRVNGYHDGESGSIILRPVFGGVSDGENHSFETPQGEAVWSSWFDITEDGQGPWGLANNTWSWSDVKGLSCDVEASIEEEGQLFCSMIEIRVTYNNVPVISDVFPVHGSMDVAFSPTLNITVVDPDGDCLNVIWYSNCSGSWQVFGVNSSVYNGTYYQVFSNASENGKWWYWRVMVYDGSVYVNSSVFKFYTGNESKIVNTGSTNISGYLLIQVDYLVGEEWMLDTEVVDETSTRVISVGGQLGLDQIFNPEEVNTSSLSHGSGTYRVYAAFCDPDDDVLVCSDSSSMEAWYEFTVEK